MRPYVVLDKQVGETPLQCVETWRSHTRTLDGQSLTGIPLAYAGRLDPMASGKLLVLIGEECKQQQQYHGLDKEYEFAVLFGVHSDSGDVLGIVEESGAPECSETALRRTLAELTGTITLPYPAFSSKTVQGKPLHTWTVEGRLDEIEIPTYTATIHELELLDLQYKTRAEIFYEVSEKIETIPPVTEARKALGNDFRRPDVRAAWKAFHAARTSPDDPFPVAHIRAVGSSGLYMRTLSQVIAERLNTTGLAYSIKRTKLGTYNFNAHSWVEPIFC